MTNEDILKKDILKKDILEQVRTRRMDKEIAFRILRQLNQAKEPEKKDIAIIGISCKFPGAKNTTEYWHVLRNGVSGIRKFPDARMKDILAVNGNMNEEENYHAGYLEDVDKFDAGFFRISPREALLMEPAQRLLLETVYEAIEDSGYGGLKIRGSKTGVFIGRDHLNCLSYVKMLDDIDLTAITGSFPGILSSRISYALDLHGPAIVVDTTCSSGLVAVHMACKAIRNNECPLAVAGGINLLLYPLDSTTKIGEVEATDGDIRVFDKSSKGTVWGEGVAALILKPLDSAIADRDNIYAVIKGIATNNDGSTNGITAPNAEAQTSVILNAWEEAKVSPESIAYVEAHGTGTILGDPIEIKSLTDAFRQFTQKRQFCGIGSVKTNIGHTVGASGLASLIKVVLSLKNKELPMSLNFREPNPYIDFYDSPLYVNDKTTKWEKGDAPRRAGVSAFGFSGTNCHVVLEEAPESFSESRTNKKDSYILALSARSEKILKELVKRYKEFLDSETAINIADICYTANTGRGHYTHRLALKINNHDELRQKLDEIIRKDCFKNLEEKGIFYGEHKVVPDNKEVKDENEITHSEGRQLNMKAASMMLEGLDEQMIVEICNLYIKGADISWDDLFTGENRRRVSLPPYPFDKVRYWPKARYNADVKREALFHHTVWIEQKLNADAKLPSSGITMVLKGKNDISNDLVNKLREAGTEVIEVGRGESFKRLETNSYEIAETEDDYKRLLEKVGNDRLTRIIHIASITENREKGLGVQPDDLLKNGLYSLFHLTRQLVKIGTNQKLEIVLISDYANKVTGMEEEIKPENLAFFGLGKTIRQENAGLKCRCIDIDRFTTGKEIVQEIELGGQDYQTALRNGKRYLEELRELDMERIEKREISFKEDGVYLITGGIGGIGLKVAQYLSLKGKVKIALINRHTLPQREEWKNILRENKDINTCKKINAILNMELEGAVVECYGADVCVEEEMKQVIELLKSKHGKINGIIHAAGTMQNGFIADKDEKILGSVLDSKIKGTWILDKLTSGDHMDFFVMFSSVSSIIGGQGQGDYAAANSYLDSFEAYRSKAGKKTVVINWTAWESTGMAEGIHMNRDNNVFKLISPHNAIRILDLVLQKEISRVVIGELNYNSSIAYLLDLLPIRFSNSIKTKISLWESRIDTNSNAETIEGKRVNAVIKGKTEDSRSETEEELAQIWAQTLELKEIDIYESFNDMGGDSILAVRLAKAIESKFPGAVDVSDIFSYPSVIRLAEYIEKKKGTGKQQKQEKLNDFKKGLSEAELKNLINSVKTGKATVEKGLDAISHWGMRKDE